MRYERLREVRLFHQFTQGELAERTGISEKQIRRYEAGESRPSSDHLEALVRALDVSADYLLGLTDDPGLRFVAADYTAIERRLILEARRGLTVEALQTLLAVIKTQGSPD